jgi:hypothetical protein
LLFRQLSGILLKAKGFTAPPVEQSTSVNLPGYMYFCRPRRDRRALRTSLFALGFASRMAAARRSDIIAQARRIFWWKIGEGRWCELDEDEKAGRLH